MNPAEIPAPISLLVAILAEVVATTALKATQGFSRPLPSLLVVLGYGVAFYGLSLTLRSLPLGPVYAIWSGVGTALIAVVGILAFGESITAFKVFGLLMIVGGTFLLRMASTQS